MRDLLVTGIVLAITACGARPAKPRAAGHQLTQIVSSSATSVVFQFESGSCWGASLETRRVAIGADSVYVSGPQQPEVSRSLAWWTNTRDTLNAGLALTRPRGRFDRCDRPNNICAYRIVVRDGARTHILRGCCNSTDGAWRVRDAFRRLKPGGPSGPSNPPVP